MTAKSRNSKPVQVKVEAVKAQAKGRTSTSYTLSLIDADGDSKKTVETKIQMLLQRGPGL